MKGTLTVKMRKRIFWVIGIFFIVCFSVLIGKLFVIQMVDGDFYKTKANNQQLSDSRIGARRGTIFDRNLNTLAKSATVWNISLSPVDIEEENCEIIAETLADVLDLDKEAILKKTKSNTLFAEVKRKVEKKDVDLINKFITNNKIKGIHMAEDTKRYYPQGSLASTVLGFTGTDNQGLAGVELFYNKQLTGTPGRVVSAKNAWGNDMPLKYEKLYEPIKGNDLVLSIDQGIQLYLEKYLDQAVKEYNVKSKACGIVMDVKNGEILGMATKPDFDPNQPFYIVDENIRNAVDALSGDEKNKAKYEAQSNQWRNKTVSDLYEPGSVYKIITGSAGLEEKVVKPDDHFNCSGSVKIGVEEYHCHKTTGHGSETFVDGMKNSCNPVFIEIGQRLGVGLFDKYVKSFGMKEKTGIDLPGEEKSIPFYDYSIYNLASNSFGQTIKVTPIQMISAACAAINGGYLYQPHIVKQILDDNGNVVESINPNIKRQVISENTSAEIRNMLEKVITEGGGKNAKVLGYRLGGKSGTSQKLDIEDKEARIASFFSFAPVEDPQIAILIICDEPQSDSRYGSTVSAPVVSKIFADVLPYLGVEPEYSEEDYKNMNIQTPNILDISVAEATNLIENKKLKIKIIGGGETILKQIPEQGKAIPNGATVVAYTEEIELKKTGVPDFNGLSYNEAKNLATNTGLTLKPTGAVSAANAIVVSQSIEKSESVPTGSVIEVRFQDSNFLD